MNNDDLIRNYESGLTLAELGPMINLHPTTVSRKLKKLGIKLRTMSETKQLDNKINHNYFSKPNSYNSYWAGFLAGDGNIYKRPKSSHIIQLCLQQRDKNHIEKFCSDIGHIRKLCIENKKYKNKRYIQYRTTIYSDKLCEDLHDMYNIIPKKSLILKPPKIKNKQNILSFIIGIIDSDGCITYNHKPNLKLSIVGTKELLSWIKKYFIDVGSLYKANKNNDKNTWRLEFYGDNCREILKKCHFHIKKHNLPVLERKWRQYIVNLS